MKNMLPGVLPGERKVSSDLSLTSGSVQVALSKDVEGTLDGANVDAYKVISG